MGTEKRARQKANRQAKLAERKAESTSQIRQRSTRKIATYALVVIGIVGAVILFGAIRGGDDDTADVISFAPTPVPDTEDPAPEVVELADEVPGDFEAFAGTGALASVKPEARNNVYGSAPAMTIDPSKSYAAVLNTDVGPIRLELFAAETPLTVNNFVNLARDGFYDGVTFHRVLEGFMAQGGDPTGSGTGGPGYAFEDEVDTGRSFDSRGLLAMANAGPATNGSQFFITFVPTQHLDGKHTIFGRLVGDDAILDEIARSDSGPPTVINSVQIVEG